MVESVQSLTRALRLVQLLCNGSDALGPAEMGRQLDLHITTVMRLLRTLEAEGFVVKLPSGKYEPSPNLVVMASRWSHLVPAAAITRSVLLRVRDVTGETAAVTVRSGTAKIVVDAVESPHSLRVRARSGHSTSLLSGPTGYALLADTSPRELARIRADVTRRYGDRGLVSRATEEAAMQQLREHGYLAIIMGQPASEGRTLAVPIRGKNGSVVAALGVIGPPERWSEAQVEACVDRIKAAAVELSESLDPELAGRWTAWSKERS